MQLSAFKTYVKYNFKRTDKDTELVQFYNDSIMAVAIKMPQGAYKYQSYLPLVAKQEDYPLPASFMHVLHPVRLLLGSAAGDSGFPLNHITKQEYDRNYPNPNRTDPDITGEPKDYTIFSGAILIGPLPVTGTDNLLELDWTTQPTAQSGDSDIPALGTEWDEVFKQMTLSRLNHSISLSSEGDVWRGKYEDAEGNPVGIYKDLLNMEKSREQMSLGQVSFNPI